MATKTKAKPKAKSAPAKAAPAKAKAAKTKAAPAKAKAAKASAAAATKPKAPTKMIADGAFARFTGYRSDISDDEKAFEEGDILSVIEHEENEDSGILYICILASDRSEYEANGDKNVTGGEVAPSELIELKGGALDKARDQFVPIVDVGELEDLLDEHDGDTVALAVSLNHGIQEKYFYMGGALAKTLQTGAHLKENGGDYDGDDAWAEFCQNELGFKGSKGRQLARMYQTFSQIPNFDPAVLESVGWSKAAIAERFVTPENVDSVLELSETTSQRELATELKMNYTDANGTTASGKSAGSMDKLKTLSITLRLAEDSAETVQLAIAQAKKQHGIEDDGLAIEAICLEWAQNADVAPTAAKRITSKGNAAAKRRAAVEKAKEKPAEKSKAKSTKKK